MRLNSERNLVKRFQAGYVPVVVLLCLARGAWAAEIKGKVVDAKEATATIESPSEYVPSVGDPVEIYFEIPGLDEKAAVASGKVREVNGNSIIVVIEKKHAKVVAGQLASIQSASPRKKSVVVPGPHGNPKVGPAAGHRPQSQLLVCPLVRGTSVQLVLLNSDGTELKNLTSNKSSASYPAWSPGGKWIVFSSSDSSGGGLFVIDADGGRLKHLTHGADVGAAWSPDGTTIVFTRYGQGATNVTQLMAIRVEVSPAAISVKSASTSSGQDGSVALTDGSAYDADPAWSPKGKRIAFASNRSGGGFRLYVMNPDGTDIRDVSQSDNPGGHVHPNWRPDGLQFAYTDRAADGTRQLFVIGFDGKNKKQITKRGFLNTFGTWLEGGQKIAFISYPSSGSKGSLVVMNADGSQPIVILKDQAAANGGRPAWKPK